MLLDLPDLRKMQRKGETYYKKLVTVVRYSFMFIYITDITHINSVICIKNANCRPILH